MIRIDAVGHNPILSLHPYGYILPLSGYMTAYRYQRITPPSGPTFTKPKDFTFYRWTDHLIDKTVIRMEYHWNFSPSRC